MSKFSDAAIYSRCERTLSAPTPKLPSYSFRGQHQNIPSLITTDAFLGTCAPTKVYTGDAMLGVATMHKSNAVPVFDQACALDIAHMRR